MKRVSIKDLKARLSAVVAAAEAGETILVTRHNDAVARLGPAGANHVRRATGAAPRLRPAIRRNTDGRYLVVLDDDRGNR